MDYLNLNFPESQGLDSLVVSNFAKSTKAKLETMSRIWEEFVNTRCPTARYVVNIHDVIAFMFFRIVGDPLEGNYNGSVCKGTFLKSLRESAAIWKSKEVYFSSNRLEAMILLRAVRESVKFIQTLKDAFHGREINFELKVQSDNSTAVSWANRTSEPRLDRSPEARVLYRLIAGIEEELDCFPSLGCVATVSHIPGKANSRADY